MMLRARSGCVRCAVLLAASTIWAFIGWQPTFTTLAVQACPREHQLRVTGRTHPWKQAGVQSSSRTSSTIRRLAVSSEKEVDSDALLKYVSAVLIQILAIAAFFRALDVATALLPEGAPSWAVFVLFFGMSIRSRLFSPLDNSRPDIGKASRGEATGGFGDRIMPSWTPPGIFFPIMWILIVAPLRAASSMLVWEMTGNLCDVTILTLMLHLCIGDTWNTVNNVERRLGAAVPGVLCVWASALAAAYTYYQVTPLAGQLLLPTCLWLTVAAALVTDTWRVNNTSGSEPLYPYKGVITTEFWFAQPTGTAK
mmetsp:Transcript_35904/g.65907  ORF Transcript_35904/g.65907 Transcript_35904/m.65907 type:complete len:310 (+) Transcript_35904:61-990(+)